MNPLSADPGKIDGIPASSIIDAITNAAAFFKARALASLAKYNDLMAEGEMCSASGHHDEYLRLITASRYVISSLKTEIIRRTQAEERRASTVVCNGRVEFVEQRDTCGDCDQPMNYHLRIYSSYRDDERYRILCPFGRDFWAIVREMADSRFEGTIPIHCTSLRNIAIATRSNGAKRWEHKA